jgi:hypothetical protein
MAFVKSWDELRSNLRSSRVWQRAATQALSVFIVAKAVTKISEGFLPTLTAGKLGLLATILVVLYFDFRQRESGTVFSRALFSGFSNVTVFLFSSKTQTEVFQPIAADWQEEYCEALFKNEICKARWINIRYTYAFLAAMWMKSPVGDVIEFVMKVAKK